MQPLTVIVAQSDLSAASTLALALRKNFRAVVTANSLLQVRSDIARVNAQAVVLDLELAGMADMRELCNDFPQVAIICTHRVPDDAMWMEAMAHGAADCCALSDETGIVGAVCRNTHVLHTARAA